MYFRFTNWEIVLKVQKAPESKVHIYPVLGLGIYLVVLDAPVNKWKTGKNKNSIVPF